MWSVPNAEGEDLNAVYEAVLAHPRWSRRNGTDFVFYESHSGFMLGSATEKIKEKLCGSFAMSTMIIHNRPMRNICQNYLQMQRLIVAPYVPNYVVQHALHKTVLPTMMPIQNRTQLLYFRGRCKAQDKSFVGMLMRSYLVQRFSKFDTVGVKVGCTDDTPAPGVKGHEPFAEVVGDMQQSMFCLALPGDAASSRRLSEMLGVGCIPVFLGPPFHSTPIAYAVDWPSMAIFINITEHSGWMEDIFRWSISTSERALHGQDARWWITDAKVSHALVTLDTVDEVRCLLCSACSRVVSWCDVLAKCQICNDNVLQVIPFLQQLPESHLERLLTTIRKERSKFAFADRPTTPPNAVDVLMDGICLAQVHRLQQTLTM